MEQVEKKLKLLTVLVGLTLLFSVLTFATSMMISSKLADGGTPSGTQPTTNPTVAPTGNTVKVDVDTTGAPVNGDKNAPVTIVEFSDFECPFCGRYHAQTHPLIVENYVDTGKVKFVFKHFPLNFHASAQKASEAAECANDQGKFWEYHDVLFANQQALSISNLKQYAADLSLDTAEFNSCLDSGEHAAKIKQDLADGQAAGVSGTPSFFINGQKLVGAQPYSAFEQAIEAALNA